MTRGSALLPNKPLDSLVGRLPTISDGACDVAR